MSWIKYRTPEESLAILGALAKICMESGGRQSCELYAHVTNNDFRAIIDYSIDYNDPDTDDIIYARQIQALFSKLDFLPLGVDRESVAFEKFLRAEQMCRDANIRLKTVSPNGDVEAVLFYAQQKIDSILGELPPLDDVDFCFGPGANTNVKSSLSCPRAKLGAQLTCSTNMVPLVSDLLYEAPEWVQHHSSSESDDFWKVEVAISPGKLVFVPKNALTDRSIVVEPVLNSFFQKGFGTYLKDRLLRSGVNLFDQSRNQSLAERASVDDSLSTIDLSMASDCLCRQLVFSLLPPPWSEMLDALRTSEVVYKGNRILLEKFSSMGNAFTFELESLIFFAISFSVCKHLGLPRKDISVYGDDIIVPVGAYDLLKKVLEHVGFLLNEDKSYKSGPFRESCGADYLTGLDIRPFYQKTLVSDRNLYTMHNWFLRHGEVLLARAAASYTCPTERLYGPDGYGDGHLLGDYTLSFGRRARRAGWGGGYFFSYHLRPRSFVKPLPGDAILPSYSVYTRSGKDSYTDPNVVRGSIGYEKISIYTFSTGIFQ